VKYKGSHIFYSFDIYKGSRQISFGK